MNGDCMNELVAAIGKWDSGTTIYDQFILNGSVTGELFNMPAGPVGAAFGAEYRKFSINDQPGIMSTSGSSWGFTSAQVTKGRDNVKEIFTEIEVPLLKGIPAVESLSLNMSARAFDYSSVKDTDFVWKAGLSWQVIPSVRLRASKGTSYRAPGLYELYLGNQSGFLSQTQIDPCINWGESNNDHIRANCAAAGIPDNYGAAGASSATVYQGGGAGFLKPETSNAFTAGLVLTPTFAPVSIAFDYFNYEVRDQISELTAATILGGCYASAVYPNNYCSMFKRNPSTGATPHMITDVFATYVNVNMQRVRGYDLLARFDKDFGFGKLVVEGQFTYTMEDVSLLFDDPTSSGLTRYNNVGYIGRPKLTGNLRTALTRGDWNYTWSMDYVGETENLDLSKTFTYQGWKNAVRDTVAESRLYHTLSVRYDQPKWSVLVGVNNVLDKAPPQVSSGVATRYGNVPAFATQYDLYGRTFFARYSVKF
jgi:iron complex outermembrane receptor protein